MPWHRSNASRLCSVPTVPSFSRRRSSRLERSQRDVIRCLICPVVKCRRPLDNAFAHPYAAAPAVSSTSRRAYSRPSARLSDRNSRFASAKPIAPKFPPVFPPQMKYAQLMRRPTPTAQVNPRRNGRIPSATSAWQRELLSILCLRRGCASLTRPVPAPRPTTAAVPATAYAAATCQWQS